MVARRLLVAFFLSLGALACRKHKSEPLGHATEIPDAATAPPKHRLVAETLLEKGPIDVYLDPRKPGVIAPERFLKDTRLILKFGRELAVPIPDLAIGDGGISGTLSFDQQPFYCFVPWSSVFAIVEDSGRGMVWDENIPPELRDR